MTTGEHLWRTMEAAARRFTIEDGQALERAGVSRSRWLDLHDADMLGVAPIDSDKADRFEPAEEGRPFFLLAVTERVSGGIVNGHPTSVPAMVDIVAFDIAKPAEWFLRLGNAWALGFDEVRRAQYCDGPDDGILRLSARPLEWLREGGACVLEWSREALEELRSCKEIAVARDSFARSLYDRLAKPYRMPAFSLWGDSRRAA